MVFKLAFQKLKKKLNSYFTDSTLDEFDVWLFSNPNNIGINDKLVYGSLDTSKDVQDIEKPKSKVVKCSKHTQTQVNFTEQDSSNYPNLVYSYSFENQKFDNSKVSMGMNKSSTTKL